MGPSNSGQGVRTVGTNGELAGPHRGQGWVLAASAFVTCASMLIEGEACGGLCDPMFRSMPKSGSSAIIIDISLTSVRPVFRGH
jgi:hypothetical protein